MNTSYDYVIIGAGVSGCTTAKHLKTYSDSILLIDKLEDVAMGASGAAGAFLSPLLGKPNAFKDLVTTSLRYSNNFYTKHTKDFIDTCGTTRIPKDSEDNKKFKSYIPFNDFDYTLDKDGYHFKDASVVSSYDICKHLTNDIDKLFNYEVKTLEYEDDIWIINSQYKAKNIILTTGYSLDLIDEFYLNIRPVWGQRIVIQTSTCIPYNYHKECSVSRTIKKDENTYITSIGATHHRFVEEKETNKTDTETLLKKANDILELKDVNVIQEIGGARASSVDYFPLLGSIINSKKTLDEFPYMKNGTNVLASRFSRYKNMFILNGVGGRGFVLAPYLSKMLVDHIVNGTDVDESLKVDRLFKREVKRLK